MKFFGKANELLELKSLITKDKFKKSECIVIKGPSGTGKTTLIKEVVHDIYQIDKDVFILYINIQDDLYEANQLFNNIIMSSFHGMKYQYSNISNINVDCSLKKYMYKMSKKNSVYTTLIQALSTFISLSHPYGSVISEAIGKGAQEAGKLAESLTLEDVIGEYFSMISKKKRIIIIVDNYQFISSAIQTRLENIITNISSGLSFFTVFRTLSIDEKIEPICSNFQKREISLSYIQKDICDEILDAQQLDLSSSQKELIFHTTKGNLKEIEIILNNILDDPNYNIIESKVAIRKLKEIQKYILIITAIFPAGMRENHMITIVQKLLNSDNYHDINSSISFLVKLGYIYKNSQTLDLVKPTHETIINNIKEAIDLNDLQYIIDACENSLESLVCEIHGQRDYGYLLHCLIGIMNTDKLLANVGYIEELVNLQFRQESYYYIVALYNNIKDIIFYLPENIVEKFLISFQRVSNFKVGLDLIAILRQKAPSLYAEFQIYYVKYLIQTYNFMEALSVMENLPITSALLLCKTNVLQHMGRDTDMKQLLENEMDNISNEKEYYIILRNTAHYYRFDEAQQNLLSALNYFDDTYHRFTYATILNNLSVINLWNNNRSISLQYLSESYQILQDLNSNELFEPACNLGVLYLLENKMEKSKESFFEALEHCPKALSMDIVMLNVNLAMANLISKEKSPAQVFDILDELINTYPVIDDPWYKFQLYHNRNSVAKMLEIPQLILSHSMTKYIEEYSDGLTKFYIIYPFNNTTFCIGLSPNWRY